MCRACATYSQRANARVSLRNCCSNKVPQELPPPACWPDTNSRTTARPQPAAIPATIPDTLRSAYIAVQPFTCARLATALALASYHWACYRPTATSPIHQPPNYANHDMSMMLRVLYMLCVFYDAYGCHCCCSVARRWCLALISNPPFRANSRWQAASSRLRAVRRASEAHAQRHRRRARAT